MTEAVRIMTAKVWPFAIVLIAFVIFQAVTFLRMATKFNSKHHVLSDADMRASISTGALSVIGPAFSVIVIALSLVAILGPAITFMRVGVIGSASYELNLANVAAESMNVVLGSPEFSEAMIVVAMFGMVLGSAPYFINCFLTLEPMDKALTKPKTNKESFTPLIGFASSIGLIGRSALQNAVKLGAPLVAIIASGIVTYLLRVIIKKTGASWLNSWILAICLIVGMAAGSIYAGMNV